MRFSILQFLILPALVFSACQERIDLVPQTGKNREIAVLLNSLRLKEHADYDRFEASAGDYRNVYLSLSRLDPANVRLLQRLALASLEGEDQDVQYAIKVAEKIRSLAPDDPDCLYLEMYMKFLAVAGKTGKPEITDKNSAIAEDATKSIEAFFRKFPDYAPPKGVKPEQWKEIASQIAEKIKEKATSSQRPE